MRPDLEERLAGIRSGMVVENQITSLGIGQTSPRGEGRLTGFIGTRGWLRALVADTAHSPEKLTPRVWLAGMEVVCVQDPNRAYWAFPDLPLGNPPDRIETEWAGAPPDAPITTMLILDQWRPYLFEARVRALCPRRFHLRAVALHSDLDARRTRLGLSWRDVGRATGCAPSTFSRMREDHPPSADNLLAILAWLGWPDVRKFAEQVKLPDGTT